MARCFDKSFRMVAMKQGLGLQFGIVLACAVVLAGCASERGSSISPIADQLTGTSFGPKANEPKDFVIASRPAQQDYLPVGVTPPQRDIKPKTAAELAAQQATMSGQAQSAQGLGAAAVAEGARVKSLAPKPPKVD